MLVTALNLFKRPTTALQSVLLSTAVVSMLVMTGCASRPQVNVTNNVRYATAPDVYTVRSGDTLSGISARYGLSYDSVAAMNDIAPPYRIYVGQAIYLRDPSRQRHVSTQAVTDQNSGIQRESIALPASKTQISAAAAEQASSEAVTQVTQTPVAIQNARWVRPAQGKVLQHFDLDKDIKGVRFDGKKGDPIVAAADGQVVYASDGLKEYGNLVLIKHVEGYITAYAHNNKMLVKSGDNVKAGQKIAEMGATGTTQTMLEFQVRLDGKAVNPTTVLPIN